MTTGRGSIEMPIATAVTAILIFVYIFLLVLRWPGKWLRTFGSRRGQGAGRGRNAKLARSADPGARFPAERGPLILNPAARDGAPR
jgi:hypothetical protein